MTTPKRSLGPPPDPTIDAVAFVRRSLKAHGGRLPTHLPIPNDAITEYNVRHAILTEGDGLTFREANARMFRDYPELCQKLGLTGDDDR